MRITSFPAGPLAANCYLLAADGSAECVVIDTGQQAAAPLRTALTERGLRPTAVLITHGHFDHVASAAEICAEYGVDVYVGGGDVPMLTGQWSAMPDEIRLAMTPLLHAGEDLDRMRPDRLTPLAGRETLHLAGLTIEVLAIPGHTPGSLAYLLPREGEADIVFTGDTLFRGSIGRTDLPGGSTSLILTSIAEQLLTLADDTIVAPGHGPASTIGAERRGNPFLAEL